MTVKVGEPTLTADERLDHLREGRDTYARRAWHDAYQAFLRADEATPLEADDLERLATAAYLIGRELEFQRLIERLHRVHLEADDARTCGALRVLARAQLLVPRRRGPVERLVRARAQARSGPRLRGARLPARGHRDTAAPDGARRVCPGDRHRSHGDRRALPRRRSDGGRAAPAGQGPHPSGSGGARPEAPGRDDAGRGRGRTLAHHDGVDVLQRDRSLS